VNRSPSVSLERRHDLLCEPRRRAPRVALGGIPIGLGIHYAWLDRDWSRTARGTGCLAVGGALVGGWLGFNAAGGLGALLTAIVGAAAGNNLAVIGRDVAWARPAREGAAEASPPLEPPGGALG
jgi:hypothetical protein